MLYAIMAVVAVVAVAATAYVVLSDDDDDSSGDEETLPYLAEGVVQIYGNANNDDCIDSNDVQFVQDIIDGTSEWNSHDNPFVDANNDGTIDDSDIEKINDIINKNSGTVYYRNYFGEAQEINFPLTDQKIAVTYWQQAEAVSILGHWDDVVVASAAATTVYPDLYPTDHDGDGVDDVVTVGTTGSSTKAVEDLEVFTENDVSLIIATPSSGVHNGLSGLDGTGIDIIYLWYSGPYAVSTILTLGILMDEVEKSQAYETFYNNTMDGIKDTIANVEDKPTFAINIVYSNTEERYDKNGGYTVEVGDNEGTYYLIRQLGSAITVSDDDEDLTEWGYAYKDNEWFLNNNSNIDFIVNCETSIGFNDGSTQTDFNSRFETNAELFNYMDAYANGKIIGTTYAFLGGFSGSAMMPLIAAMIYPDLFSIEDGKTTLQYWFDNFTSASVDIDSWGAYYYTGTNYNIWYNQ